MRLLFLHNNFPAQYRNLAPLIASNEKNKVVFGTMRREGEMKNIIKVYYKPAREVSPDTHHYLKNAESAILHGQSVYRLCKALKKKGFIPDVICAHSGWGPSIFIKEVFPESQLIGYFEWYYHSHNSDFNFLPYEVMEDDYLRLRIKNTSLMYDLVACDWGISPTQWQWSQFPDEFQSKLSVLHDGINTNLMCPKPGARMILDNLNLSHVDEIVTYVARGMEEYRGFPQFMQAIEILLKRRPQTHVVIVGQDRVAYGRKLPGGQTFKQKMLEELSLDMTRVHFTDCVSYSNLIKLFQASSVHVYLSVPFVLSWSMLEAMSAGCLVVGSDTPPVREAISDGENGLLVDFFDVEKIADRIEEVLEHPDQMAEIRHQARETILDRYCFRKLLPKQTRLISEVVQGHLPPRIHDQD